MASPKITGTDRHLHLRPRRSCDNGDLPLAYAATIAASGAEIVKELAGSESKTTAVSVALVDHERLLWAEAFGSIDRAHGAAPTTETLFCIASCSKVIAAVAAMILVDRGMVELDAPLVRYVTDFRMADDEPWRDITVRMLLNHSSGLPGIHFPNVLTVVPFHGYAAQVRDMLATERLKHAPGEMAVYGNDGFMLVECLVTAVTGQPYTEFVEQEILKPLGMNHSRFALEPFAPGSFAPGLDEAGRPEPQEYTNIYSSGLFSTPSDLGNLAMMFLNGGRRGGRRILSAAAVAEMGRDQTVNLAFNPVTDHHVHFGLGWDGILQGGLAAAGVTGWHKAGDADHYHSYFIVAPDERLAVVVMVTNSMGIGSIATPLAERVLLHALAERGRIARLPVPPEPATLPAIPAGDGEPAAFTGIYAGSYGLYRLDVGADRTLTLSSFVNDRWHPAPEGLRLRQDGRFVADSCPERAYRGFVAAGRRYLAVRAPFGMGHYDMELPVGHELLPGQPLSARWQARVGRRWLTANEPCSAFLALGRQPPLICLGEVQGLEGYLAVSLRSAGLDLAQVVDPRDSDHVARMCLKIPIDNGWGLSDLVIEAREGEEWILWCGTRYRPLETVPAPESGRGTVTIGPEGLGEWFRCPAASALTLAGACSWYLYNAEFDLKDWGMGEKTIVGSVDDGSYLLLYGAPGTTVTLTLQP
ncbi:serine hydrolase domain-containing protein [Syntrophobacter fumaroxidans]|uniref:serine hydrolase domain-containing protein n=1 Tax=Syntrophobacter fumaroxidans TaxID=119484 RepID=UPI0000573DEC|nr:serine hydrolase domain-containing protein [Syntrophobacter fumaroxidans]